MSDSCSSMDCSLPGSSVHRDSPGKNIGVGCHFLLQCMKVKSESDVTQSSLTLSDPMDYSLPGSSVHRIFQARVLEWGAIAFSALYPLYFNKTLLHKSSERSSLVSGPGLNSSPPGAKNPGVFAIQQQPFITY